MTPDADTTGHLGIVLLAAGLLLVAAVLLVAVELRRGRGARVIGRALDRERVQGREAAPGEAKPASAAAAATTGGRRELPAHWLDSRLGRALVAEEDRKLIDQCGWPTVPAQLGFLVLRLTLALVLPLVAAVVWAPGHSSRTTAIGLAAAFALGFMAPKWVVAGVARRRRERVAHELPLFVDLLRLLQGVGLSLDQSLQVMANDFDHVLRVLGPELRTANRQYAQGRTREHSLQRLATVHGNTDLAGLVGLMVQIDRHGGAVQEPLRQCSERLREHRRAELKERIGKITVKMTGVMVTTLLPALLIVTAGPGFIAIMRSLGALSR